jgi:hypothetical protein
MYGMTKYGVDNATGTSAKGKWLYQTGVIFGIPLPPADG